MAPVPAHHYLPQSIDNLNILQQNASQELIGGAGYRIPAGNFASPDTKKPDEARFFP